MADGENLTPLSPSPATRGGKATPLPSHGGGRGISEPHGGPNYGELAALGLRPEDVLDFSASTNAFGPPTGVAEALAACDVTRYPDRGAAPLRQALAKREAVKPDHVLAGNGAAGLIWALALAELRPDELRRSAEVIGFSRVVMLGYRDSGMADTEPNDHPDCFHQAPLDEAVGRLVEVIRVERPQVIVTYGDDQRGYPHPDHLKVHDISIPAFERAGDPSWYPELGEPWQPSKLYYSTWSKARLIAVHEGMIRLRGESPFDDAWLERPDADHRITTRLDVGEYLWARSGSLRAHATQVDPTEPWWFGLEDHQLAEVYPYEDWILARSLVGSPPEGELETDMLVGVRDQVPGRVVSVES